MKMKGAVEELVKALEELVEDHGRQQRPVDCGQDVVEEQAPARRMTVAFAIAAAIRAKLALKQFARY